MENEPIIIDQYNCYLIGETSYFRNLAKEEFKHMLHLVAYDIHCSKRRNKIAKTCEDYGLRVEFSVFECDLPPKIFEKLWATLTSIIDDEEDTLLAYQICGSCVSRIHSAGPVVRRGKILAYIF